MTKIIQINQSRLDYLLETHGVTKQWLMEKLNEGRKKLFTEHDLFSDEIKLSVLKKINELFKKPLWYYTDPAPPPAGKEMSIFFRKTDFNGELGFNDHWRINQIEGEIRRLRGYMTLSKFELERKINPYTVAKSPQRAAHEMRQIMPLKPTANDKDYLKQLIGKLSEQNILVYEFAEPHNLKAKVSWEGVFLAPYTIGIKRRQYAFKREIFTLAHELGHYLLNSEEVDVDVFNQHVHTPKLKATESWCNTFAFHFLAGEASKELPDLFAKKATIDNRNILELSNAHKISRLAIYTHLLQEKHIKPALYNKLSNDLRNQHAKQQQQRQAESERQKLLKKKTGGGTPKPIYAPLVKDIIRHAFFERVLEEHEVVGYFNPSTTQIQNGFFETFINAE